MNFFNAEIGFAFGRAMAVGASMALSLAPVVAQAQQLSFQLDDSLVRLDATVNGQRFKAVLDAGSSLLIVDPVSVARLKLAGGQDIGANDIAGPSAVAMSQVHVDTLALGDFKLQDLDAAAIDLGHLAKAGSERIEVLLGEPVFEKGVVEVDDAPRANLLGHAVGPADGRPRHGERGRSWHRRNDAWTGDDRPERDAWPASRQRRRGGPHARLEDPAGGRRRHARRAVLGERKDQLRLPAPDDVPRAARGLKRRTAGIECLHPDADWHRTAADRTWHVNQDFFSLQPLV